MSRDLTTVVRDASLAETVTYILLVQLDFDGGIVRVNSSPYSVDWNTFTWLGVGTLGEVSSVQEKSDLTATKYDLALSGIPTEMVSLALQEDYKGRDATIWLALINDTGSLTILDAPIIIFKGWMDSMIIKAGEDSKVVVSVESKLADWDIPRVTRFTDAEQQLLFPGDRGFEFVSVMEDYEILWGRGS